MKQNNNSSDRELFTGTFDAIDENGDRIRRIKVRAAFDPDVPFTEAIDALQELAYAKLTEAQARRVENLEEVAIESK